MSYLNLPDYVYNWIVHFFQNHSQRTKYNHELSEILSINASVIQGSAVGPASFLVCASDLQAVCQGNHTNKYADDVILTVPASNTDTRVKELDNVKRWAYENNLKLNASKSKEIIIKTNRKQLSKPPSIITDLERTNSIVLLGVTITENLAMSDHIDAKIIKCNRSLYALKTLKAHGMPAAELKEVFRSTILSSLLYASPAWWGFATEQNINRLDAFLRKASKIGYYSFNSPSIRDLVTQAEATLFKAIQLNKNHVLHQFLPDKTTHTYSLRLRSHNYTLPKKTSSLIANNFLCRLLYKDSY